jgi:peptidylprolyl isomerase domain and WD repeat-containing protein 1
MHKDQLSYVTVTPHTDFLITSSIDGVVKFWKKMAVGVEFVKEFRAHVGEITSTSVSADGRSFATAGTDKTVKIFDVITFGMSLRKWCYRYGMGPLTLEMQIVWRCLPWNSRRAASAGSIGVAPLFLSWQ